MISNERVKALKPGQRVESCRVGNVRVVIECAPDETILWIRETLDAKGLVVESVVFIRRAKAGRRKKPTAKTEPAAEAEAPPSAAKKKGKKK